LGELKGVSQVGSDRPSISTLAPAGFESRRSVPLMAAAAAGCGGAGAGVAVTVNDLPGAFDFGLAAD